MKSILIPITVLIISVIAVITNSLVLDHLLDLTEEEIELAQTPEDIDAAFEKYQKRQYYLELTVNHSTLRDTENIFSELRATASEDGIGEETDILKSRLSDTLDQIRRLSTIGIEGIF
jgi:hypothetical protein